MPSNHLHSDSLDCEEMNLLPTEDKSDECKSQCEQVTVSESVQIQSTLSTTDSPLAD